MFSAKIYFEKISTYSQIIFKKYFFQKDFKKLSKFFSKETFFSERFTEKFQIFFTKKHL